MWKQIRSNLEKHKGYQGCSFQVLLAVAVVCLLTMPKSDLEHVMWLEPWHLHCPYGKARVGSTSSFFHLKFGKTGGSLQAQSQQLEGGPYMTLGDLNWGQAISMAWCTIERSQLFVHDIRGKNSIKHKAKIPQAGSNETLQHITII